MGRSPFRNSHRGPETDSGLATTRRHTVTKPRARIASMGLGKSFIKGPRFAYAHNQMVCERCVWGRGEHSEDCTTREGELIASIENSYNRYASNVANDPNDSRDRDRGTTAVDSQSSKKKAS